MNISNIIIRKERISDYDRVYDVTKRAFQDMEFADGDEQELVVNYANQMSLYRSYLWLHCWRTVFMDI